MIWKLEIIREKPLLILVVFSFLLFTVVLVRNAWITDDAYITFRTIDNLVNGYGLTWNVTERVEAYSNPLWLFLTAAFYYFTKEFYFTSIVLSILISVLSMIFFVYKNSRTLIGGLLGIIIFIFSKAFIDYSASGLENPLTHLILALFLFVYIKSKNNFNLNTLFLLSVITAIAAVNRLDSVLFFIPVLVYVFLKLPKLKGIYVTIIGLLPIITWKGFTLFYYGFPFPNSAYAKVLNTGISKPDIFNQGFNYFQNSFNWDPLTLIVIFIGISIPFISKEKHLFPVVIGFGMYLFYILQIGGDFMSGRFFTAPLFVAVVLLTQCKFNSFKRVPLAVFIILILFVGFSSLHPPVLSDENFQKSSSELDNGIADERAWYYPSTGLLKTGVYPEMPSPNTYGIAEGSMARESNETPIVKTAVGVLGYYAGPQIHIIDCPALGDPLLSKFPPPYREDWRIGHIHRPTPSGYFETIQQGQNLIEDPNLAEYYEKISIITKGDLFDANRLQEIWNINTGKYDSLLDSYIHSQYYNQTEFCTKTGIWKPRGGDIVVDTTQISIYSLDYDPNPVNVCYSIDGVELECELKEAGKVDIHFFWDTTTYSDGSHSIGATSCDPSGNCASANPVVVVVDNIP